MPYLSPRAQNLPVVRYSSGVSFPGASHRVSPAQKRVAGEGRFFYSLALLGLLSATVFLIHTIPQRAGQPVASATRPVRSVYPTVTSRPPSWATHLSAHPPRGHFVRFFRMRATAYAPIHTRLEGGRYTSTLRDGQAAHGVAVDPKIIPLGSRLWIPGYGHAIADDIGGRIHGHHVDLRVQEPDHMTRWGMRPVRVYVLQEPKEQ